MRSGNSRLNLLFLIKRTRLLKNGEAPIAMRLTIRGKSCDIMIKRSIAVSMWNQPKECSRGKDYAARELNNYLESIRTRIYEIQRELLDSNTEITLQTVRDKFYGIEEEDTNAEKSLCEVYLEHNERCRALIGIEFTQSTVAKFDTSLKHLVSFVKSKYNMDDIPLSQVNGEFIRNFDFYLKTVHKCKQNSAIKHHKNLKKIVRIALSNDWMQRDPFFGIQFKHEEVDTEFLTSEELQKVINKEITIERIAQVRDVFVFCCYTGLAFADVKQLSKEHLIDDANGALWIRKSRQKTGTMCNIPVLSKAKELIEKYSSHPACEKTGCIMPVISNQRMNAYLKEIADLCGINKKLCTHTARHTCATTVMLANNVRLENVSKILGHSSIKMTQHYAKVLDKSIMSDMHNVEKNIAAL